MNRERFPGLADVTWTRLDGPAGTQMVDSAIEAMAAWMRSGPRGQPGRRVRRRARHRRARRDGARERGRAARRARRAEIVFGFSMTALTMAFAGAGRPHAPAGRRDRLLAARPRRQRRARGSSTPSATAPRCASPSPTPRRSSCPRARSKPCSPTARAGSRSPTPPTRSARSRTCPASSPPPTPRARACTSTRSTPRRTARIDVAALGCDALACSAYKWFGPHVGIQWARPELLTELTPDKLRPSPDIPP